MLEKFKEAIDRGNQFGALLTNLSKAFDGIDYKLLIVKLYGYGVSMSTLNIISSYLKHRTQWTISNDWFSARSNVECDVPQDSILGPLLFIVNIIDLLYECKKIILQIMLMTQPIFVCYWHSHCHFRITGYLSKSF